MRRWLTSVRVPADSTQVVVLAIEAGGLASGASPQELFHTALRRWQDLHVVPLDRTLDALGGRRSGRLSADEMRSVATSLGARRYVVVRLTQTPTGNAVFAEYRDAEDGSLREGQVDLPSDPSKVCSRVRRPR